MLESLRRFLVEEEGQGMAEYGLILALVAVAVIAALGLLGGKISEIFNNVTNGLSGQQSGS